MHDLRSASPDLTRLNLEDLRSRMTRRLSILTVAVGQVVILFYDSPEPFPYGVFIFWMMLTGVGLTALISSTDRSRFARHVLVWGLQACFLAAMWVFPQPWLPFLSLVLVFSGALLVQGSELVAAFLVGLAALWLAQTGQREYPMTGLLAGLAFSVVTAMLAIRTLYTALDWLWHTHQRAEQLLATTRSQQAELKSTIKSLTISNDQRARAERELVIANLEAKEARRMKEQFAANISHELRTPLSIILGFSEVMYLSPEVYGSMRWSPKLYRDVSQIYRNSRHLLGMIDDILDLSRFEMVGFTINRELTQVSAMVEDAVGIVSDLFHSGNLELSVDVASDLPLIDIDRTRMRQVLLNLLNNARRFTESGEVKLTAWQRDQEIIFSVSDTGPGIPADKLPHVFDEFFQVDYSLSRNHGGAGLGLAICHRFVEAHEGRIWVESEMGKGSTFLFSLPTPDRTYSFGQLYRTRSLAPQSLAALPHVLLVDPDPTIASMVQRHLATHDVVVLDQPGQLEAAIDRYHPEAIIWNLAPGETIPPEIIGSTHVPVIECMLPSQSWRARELGAAACLTKPLDMELLRRELGRLGQVQQVLVIDDNAGMCQLVERGLAVGEAPPTVRVAYDGRLGLAAMRSQRPDVLLLDLIMPEMDGFEVLDEMKQDPALCDLPVILLTATSYHEDSLAKLDGRLVLHRADSLKPVEVLRSLAPLIDTFRRGYEAESRSEPQTLVKDEHKQLEA